MGPIYGAQGFQEGQGRPPWALWGPKGPRGGYGEAAPGQESPQADPDPAAPPSLGRIFASAPKSESDPGFLVEKKSRDLANLDPPRALGGLPRHLCQKTRGRKPGTFDELWQIEIRLEKKMGQNVPGSQCRPEPGPAAWGTTFCAQGAVRDPTWGGSGRGLRWVFDGL